MTEQSKAIIIDKDSFHFCGDDGERAWQKSNYVEIIEKFIK
jgi:hypothetical protein